MADANMKRAHLTKRSLRKQHGFTWGRFVDERAGIVSYRLFIRDSVGRCHGDLRNFTFDELQAHGRSHVARIVRIMRRRLRWKVDQIEFRRLGLEDPTPCPVSAEEEA